MKMTMNRYGLVVIQFRSNSLRKRGCQVYILVVDRRQRNFAVSPRLKKRTPISTKSLPATNVSAFRWSSYNIGLSTHRREFLELPHSRGVDYVIVGAQSLALQ